MFARRKAKPDQPEPVHVGSISPPVLQPSPILDVHQFATAPVALAQSTSVPRSSSSSGVHRDELAPVVARDGSSPSKARVLSGAATGGFHVPSGYQAGPASPTSMPRSPSSASPARPSRSGSLGMASPTSPVPPIPAAYVSTFRASPSVDLLSSLSTSTSLPNVRKAIRLPPTLNLVVVGARGTGKTSWIKTLLGTVKTSTLEDSHKSHSFGTSRSTGNVARTRQTAEVKSELLLESGEKLALTVRDTVGLEIPFEAGRTGDALEVERQVGAIVRDIEDRFEATIASEAQVSRHSQRAQDHHLHLCLYFIHPSTIVPRPSSSTSTLVRLQTQQKAEMSSYSALLQTLPSPSDSDADRTSTPAITRTVTAGSNGSSSRSDAGSPAIPTKNARRLSMTRKASKRNLQESDSAPVDEVDEGEVGMSEIDLRAIKRLVNRVNVLPVIALSDTLTIAELEQFKTVVKRDLAREGLDFGPFSALAPVASDDEGTPTGTSFSRTTSNGNVSSRAGPAAHVTPSSSDHGHDDYGEEEDEVEPPKLIKLTRRKSYAKLGAPVRSPRKSLSSIARSESRLELAREDQKSANASSEQGTNGTPKDLHELLPFALIAPEFGLEDSENMARFERKFRYGTVDILDPRQSDFVVLRNTIFGRLLAKLKETTQLDKYEQFRTSRLIARRATANLSEQSRNELLRDLSAI